MSNADGRSTTPASDTSAPSVTLEELEVTAFGIAPNETLVGMCCEGVHPALTGRVSVEIERGETRTKLWLPVLHGLSIRPADQVLVTRPSNAAVPMVIGVIDGFAHRPPVERTACAQLAVQRDEMVRVVSTDGVPLAELFQGTAGPTLRLLSADVDLELPGALRISAATISLVARAGEMRLTSRDDLVARAETIQLNS